MWWVSPAEKVSPNDRPFRFIAEPHHQGDASSETAHLGHPCNQISVEEETFQKIIKTNGACLHRLFLFGGDFLQG